MIIQDPDNRFTVMISPKELAEKLGLEGEIVKVFIRKGHGADKKDFKNQPRIEMKVIKERRKDGTDTKNSN